jgi:hypothetical protein
MVSTADLGSARLMLAYLSRANKHYDERQFARQKLRIELKKLKRISPESMKRYIKDLESSIGEAIKKEQRILKHQQKEEVFHGDLNDRIKELEDRLARYITIHEMRAQRVKLLENAMATEVLGKKEQFSAIRRSLDKAERIYASAKRDKRHSREQLTAVRRSLDVIRAKVRQYEKKF